MVLIPVRQEINETLDIEKKKDRIVSQGFEKVRMRRSRLGL